MKIYHIIYSLTIGGAEKFAINLANRQSLSNEVGMVIINNYYSDDLIGLLNKNIKVFKINRTPGSFSPLPVFKLNREIMKERPNIIHCHNEDIVKYIFPHKDSKKVLTIHQKDIDIRYVKSYDKCFCVSDFIFNYIKERCHCQNLKRIYNGVEIKKQNIGSEFENVEYDDGKPVKELTNQAVINKNGNFTFKIVLIGRLFTECKGQHLLIKAIAELRSKCKTNIQVDIYGAGPSESYLKSLTKQLHLENIVSFKGEIDADKIVNVLPLYNLLVHPSLYEALGLSIIEAMICGVPILVSDKEGPMEIVEYTQCGTVFETGNVTDLCDKIIEVINRYDFYSVRAKENSHKIEEMFSIEKCCNEYLKEYDLLF
ncbi:MAG: glycosyltransferase family 4 protein [Bacteroidales bacterium]|nr:glycosyltransferase family 4 protein [Bacteroidales bacterium]